MKSKEDKIGNILAGIIYIGYILFTIITMIFVLTELRITNSELENIQNDIDILKERDNVLERTRIDSDKDFDYIQEPCYKKPQPKK